MPSDYCLQRLGRLFVLACCGLGVVSSFAPASRAQDRLVYQRLRQRLVREVIEPSGVRDKRVLGSIRSTPRHEFVPVNLRSKAYYDMSLPIGERQTISSPFIVAYMTESLDPQPTDRVLEIGTGSGYQAAILSPLVKDVYSIEIVESLGKKAARVLERLEYDNVHTKVGDGFKGWEEHAPFDKIIVTCSPEKVPEPLKQQLREGGLMVIPVGERYQQTLYLMRKKDGELVGESLRPTLFVPMTGTAEDAREELPNPEKPSARNGGFEDPVPDNGFVTGWYYQRHMKCESGDAPEGKQYVRFRNSVRGRSAHLLQGFAIDGLKVSRIKLSAWIKCEGVQVGRDVNEQPAVSITFYDRNRRSLGHKWIGPFRGTADWKHETTTISVPRSAKEGILRIGLFGATGAIAFDDIRIERE